MIGLFFSIVSVILFLDALLSRTYTNITLYTAFVFLLFGLVMMWVKSEKADGHD